MTLCVLLTGDIIPGCVSTSCQQSDHRFTSFLLDSFHFSSARSIHVWDSPGCSFCLVGHLSGRTLRNVYGTEKTSTWWLAIRSVVKMSCKRITSDTFCCPALSTRWQTKSLCPLHCYCHSTTFTFSTFVLAFMATVRFARFSFAQILSWRVYGLSALSQFFPIQTLCLHGLVRHWLFELNLLIRPGRKVASFFWTLFSLKASTVIRPNA